MGIFQSRLQTIRNRLSNFNHMVAHILVEEWLEKIEEWVITDFALEYSNAKTFREMHNIVLKWFGDDQSLATTMRTPIEVERGVNFKAMGVSQGHGNNSVSSSGSGKDSRGLEPKVGNKE